jgi:hypothetical protein
LKRGIAEGQDELTQTIYALYGGNTLLWARLEAVLDEINEVAFFNGGKGPPFDNQVPRNLGRKLAYLRKTHKRLPWLHGLREAAETIANKVDTLSELRHDLIHGHIMSHPVLDTLSIARNDYGDEGLIRSLKEVPTRELIKFGMSVAALSKVAEAHHGSMTTALLEYRRHHIDR